jgi:hypothetical protein
VTKPAPVAFKRGVALTSDAAVRTWLAAQRRKRVRLPVQVPVDEYGELAALSGVVAPSLAVTLDDSALGVSLADRVRDRRRPGAATAWLWLEGEWHERSATLRLAAVGAAIDPGDAAAVGAAGFAEVEA